MVYVSCLPLSKPIIGACHKLKANSPGAGDAGALLVTTSTGNVHAALGGCHEHAEPNVTFGSRAFTVDMKEFTVAKQGKDTLAASERPCSLSMPLQSLDHPAVSDRPCSLAGSGQL